MLPSTVDMRFFYFTKQDVPSIPDKSKRMCASLISYNRKAKLSIKKFQAGRHTENLIKRKVVQMFERWRALVSPNFFKIRHLLFKKKDQISAEPHIVNCIRTHGIHAGSVPTRCPPIPTNSVAISPRTLGSKLKLRI